MKIAILGAGQLGGSLALALRESGADISFSLYDSNPAHAQLLAQKAGIDTVAATPQEAVKDANVVMLAAPLRAYPALARAIAPALSADAVVTDVGSVKCSMAALSQYLPAARLVPAHPIAGTEKAGPEAANGALFRGKICILTPDDSVDASAIEAVETLWHLVGADVLRMPTQVHDQIYAHVSHLPHYIAFITAEFLYRAGVRVDGDNAPLQQFLRISRSNARMWTDVALENREALLAALTTYTAMLEHFVAELKSGAPGNPVELTTLARTMLPRMLAATLISCVSLYEQQSGIALKPFGGAGLRDISAPAATAPEADTQAISDAAASVAAMLEQILPLFRQLESLIGSEDEPALFAALSTMAEDAAALTLPRQ